MKYERGWNFQKLSLYSSIRTHIFSIRLESKYPKYIFCFFCTSLFVRWCPSTDSIHFFRYDCHPFKLFVIPIMCIESVLVSFVSTILHIALALASSLISWFFEIFWYGRRANDEVQATKMRREIVCGIFSKLNAYMITKHIFKYFGFGVFLFGRLVFLLLHSIQFKSDRKNNNKFSSILSLA